MIEVNRLLLQKLKTYIGFSLKNRSIIIGSDAILSYQRTGIVIYRNDLSENILRKIKNKRNDSILIELTKDEWDSLGLKKDSIKIVMITDKNMIEEIKRYIK